MYMSPTVLQLEQQTVTATQWNASTAPPGGCTKVSNDGPRCSASRERALRYCWAWEVSPVFFTLLVLLGGVSYKIQFRHKKGRQLDISGYGGFGEGRFGNNSKCFMW